MCLSDQKTPILLRPHHGLCLAWFRGYGYSAEFCANTWKVLDELLTDPVVKLVVGCDVVCAPCPNNHGGECEKADRLAAQDRAVLRVLELEEGTELSFARFTQLVQEKIIGSGRRSEVCGDCRWQELCSTPGRWKTMHNVQLS